MIISAASGEERLYGLQHYLSHDSPNKRQSQIPISKKLPTIVISSTLKFNISENVTSPALIKREKKSANT